MDLKLIQKLIAMMKRGGLAELDLEDSQSGVKVRLKREVHTHAPAPLVQVVGGGTAAAGVVHSAGGAVAAQQADTGGAPPVKEVIGTPIPSPMVGTFYRAGSPEAEPFITVGMRITPDKVLCIIEAMKVMNEIKAEISGEVLEILADNGDPVEFGQPLFLVKTD